MSSNFSFPKLTPAKIVEELAQFDIAPVSNLRPEDIANPQPDLLPAVLSCFLASYVDAPGDELDGEGSQLGFNALEVLDNPEHHGEAIRVLRLYRKARAFLDSIHFRGFLLADLLRPHPSRVADVLSAIVNFLYFREEKLSLLHPIVSEAPNYHEGCMELKAKIAQLQKEIADHELAKQMEEPMVQQLEAEVSDLKQKALVYNKQQVAVRAKAKTMTEEKEEILSKMSQADFELMKHAQENSKLLSKIVQSPEKIQRALEEKKSAHAELKNSEKTEMQNVQEKIATLEIYTKASEKQPKLFSKIQDLHEQVSAAKTIEKEAKARKAKLSDENVSSMALDAKLIEWQRKVHEKEERLKVKRKERNQRIADDNQKLGALRSETEYTLQCLEPRERRVEEKIAKATSLCAEADSIRIAATEEQQQIHAKFENVVQACDCYMDTINRFLGRVEELGK